MWRIAPLHHPPSFSPFRFELLSAALSLLCRPYSFFRYWDAVAKQQQLQRKAEEESHRQQWVAYFEGQATAGTAVIGEQSGEQELDDAQYSSTGAEAVGVFDSIFYKVDKS